MKHKILTLVLSVAVIASLVFIGCAPEAAPPAPPEEEEAAPPEEEEALPSYHWRLGHNKALDHPEAIASQNIVDEIKTASNGRIIIDIYPSGQLGDWQEVWDKVMADDPDVHFDISCPSARYDPRAGLYEIPYIYESMDDFLTATKPGGWVDNIYQEIFAGQGLISLGAWPQQWGALVLNEMAPRGDDFDMPLNLQGRKLRVPPAPGVEIFWEHWGAIPVHMPASEIVLALSSGVIDGWVGGNATVHAYRFLDSTNVWVLTRHNLQVDYLVTNLKLWNSLDKETQDIIYTAAQRESEKAYSNMAEIEETCMQRLKDANKEMIILTQEEINKAAKVTHEEVWPQLEEMYTKELLDEIRSHVS